jgi:methionine-rich copper-binding protein CopC
MSTTVARWSAQASAVLMVAGGALLGWSGPASAHGQMAMSNPVRDSTVSTPLARLELYFTERPAANAHLTVTAPSGQRVDAGWRNGEPKRLDKPVQEYFLIDGNWEPRVYHTGYPALLAVSHWPAKGTYTASYLSVASDGEPVKGTLTFRYAGRPTPPPAGWTAPTDGPSPDLLQAAEGGTSARPSAGGGLFSDLGSQPDPAAKTPAPAAEQPAGNGAGIGPWVLPGLLIVAVAAIVLHAARKPPRPRRKAARAAGR